MKLNYLLTLIVIAISGNPAMLVFGKEATYILVFLVLLFIWANRMIRINRPALLFLSIIGGLVFVHLFSFGTMVLMSSLGFLIKICIGILAPTVVTNFFRIYVRWMAILACVSLVFYFPYLLGVDLSGPLSFLQVHIQSADGLSAIRHIGIHNFHIEEEMRNSGMFWEPGAFAGYLVLALTITISRRMQYMFPRWEILALIAGLISTQSTMGYICGLVAALYYYWQHVSKRTSSYGILKASLILTSAAVFSYFIFLEIDFLGDKIETQLLNTQAGIGMYQINRFGNIFYDFDYIEERPLTGWSGAPATRFSVDPTLEKFVAGHGVGLTAIFVRFGVLGGLALFIGIYLAAVKASGRREDGIFLVAIISLILIGEQFTNFPLIYSFLVASWRKDQPINSHLSQRWAPRR